MTNNNWFYNIHTDATEGRTDKAICRGRFAPKILHAKDSEKMCCYLVAVITAAVAVAADTVLGVAVIRQAAAVAGG